MNDSELFKRAANDATFRREQLADQRYFKNVGLGVVSMCAVLGAAISLYGGLTTGEWDQGLGLLLMAFLAAGTYPACSARAAALQALEERQA